MIYRVVRTVALVAAISIAAFVGDARADVIFNNLARSSTGSDPISAKLYASFSTPSYRGFLGPISLDLFASNPADGGSFAVALVADAAGSPGGLIGPIGTIADSSLSGSSAAPSIITLVSTSSFALSANTRYWLRLISKGAFVTSANWLYDNSSRGVGVASEFNLNSVNTAMGITSNSSGSSVYLMSVSDIPEPGSGQVILVGFGALAFVYGARARRRKPAC